MVRMISILGGDWMGIDTEEVEGGISATRYLA